MLGTYVWCQTQCLGSFSGALDRPEGQEKVGEAVGGQGQIHGVTILLVKHCNASHQSA